ncbi:dTDP-4-dehydrorhamnose reductase [Paenibacillus sp. IHBB 10380]|uniref:dTDP-4-dehydrorhamnose reductase n=1 Tax=Paenibacillus sp. IHBB 10380 TaxID=1566358 RepID=UPI0005CFAAE6|nr:dTDP-4-dehydrorhamnose reductase [Paenibacillus sp. IHBB 10380]AJS59950.1 dTDP-4-dehydrorhamnose reductase [Paenibacillus sp. IHBB 10380]
MRVLITGANGQLGSDIVDIFNSIHQVFAFGRDTLDITNIEEITRIAREIKPDVIIHAAAYTAVDQAESNLEDAFEVNAYGTRNVAIAAEDVGAKLVYISTDYVFDGTNDEPYSEHDVPSPLGVYGESKYAGEQYAASLCLSHFIVRTSWVYGKYGNNFVKTMIQLGKERKSIRVVNDQTGSPTYTVDLVHFLLELIESDKYGVYHATNVGQCTWYDLAKAIFEIQEMNDVTVEACSTEEFPRPAARPRNSVLGHSAIKRNGFTDLPPWREALECFLKI